MNRLFCKWKEANTPRLKAHDKDGRPKALIETVAENLLATFRKAPLLDAYHLLERIAQPAFHVAHGTVYAALAIPSRTPQSTAGAP